MKKKIIKIIFISLILITAIATVTTAILSYIQDLKSQNPELWVGFAAFAVIMIGGCVVFYELDLFFTVYYFFVKPKTLTKSILNVASNLILVSIFFSDSIAHFLYKTFNIFDEELLFPAAMLVIYFFLKITYVVVLGLEIKTNDQTETEKESKMNLSVCGIDCNACNHFVENKCKGCREVAPKGECVWGGSCDLYDCAAKQNLIHCGKCVHFPCETLKEWASNENTERIQNLIDLNG